MSQNIDQIIADMETEARHMLEEQEAKLRKEINAYRNAARSYRAILIGGETDGDLSFIMEKEFNAAEKRHADLMDKGDEY